LRITLSKTGTFTWLSPNQFWCPDWHLRFFETICGEVQDFTVLQENVMHTCIHLANI
jgi:hypothetical protein